MRRILIVDDELNILKVLEKFLTLKGFEVMCANRGEDALKNISSEATIDLIIVDLRMPQISGIDILKHVGSTRKKIPAIILSGCPLLEPQDSAALESLGYSEKDIYCKPVDLFSLLDVVNEKLPPQN
jgi:DNA-binding NtrC family response regulator